MTLQQRKHHLNMENCSSPDSILNQEIRCSVLQVSLPTALCVRCLIVVALLISGSDLWSDGLETILTSGVFHLFEHSHIGKYNI